MPLRGGIEETLVFIFLEVFMESTGKKECGYEFQIPKILNNAFNKTHEYASYQIRLFDCQVIYAGDSAADEIAIERLKGVAYTFRVINEDADVITKTAADYRLAGKNLISLFIATDT